LPQRGNFIVRLSIEIDEEVHQMGWQPTQRENNNDDDEHFDCSLLAHFCMSEICGARISRNPSNPELK